MISPQRDSRGDAGLAATVLTWAAAFPAIRVGLDGYTPWALGLLRLAAASATLGLVAAVFRPGLPHRRHWPRLVVCGLVGQTLYQLFLMIGEVSVPPGTASVLIATAPIFSVVAAAVLLRERLGPHWRGFLLAFAGAVVAGASLGLGGGAAALIVVAAAACQGLYHVAVKPVAEQLGALAATTWSVWAGCLLGLPALPALLSDAATASRSSTLAAVFLGVVPSGLGYLAWSDALARTTITRSTVALYLVPGVAMLLSWAWLRDPPTVLAVIGGLLAIGGVTLVRRQPSPPAPRSVPSQGARPAPIRDPERRP
ncbi:DMT family transporter [Actinomadura darangshiensis]|uniref:DMT family transporter n=1 Tax=Actinomadura darangshiensis TaxID=705336 RepID=A0A4V2YXH3_9ACTN|nr:DMT family transporter [Actinomadura darangshiensis]TDD89327.1 DMT family transporter [Actinomadura darangshiensis]